MPLQLIVTAWLYQPFASAPRAGDPETALLGHQWKMTEKIDEHCLSTRVVEGHATFNMARLYGSDDAVNAAFPDDFRSYLFLPVPFGFRRLIRAQAAGDFETLKERGRRVARIRLEDV